MKQKMLHSDDEPELKSPIEDNTKKLSLVTYSMNYLQVHINDIEVLPDNKALKLGSFLHFAFF